MTRIEDLEIFENSIYEIYYNGKMFNPQLCISHVEKDHEIVNRLKELIDNLREQRLQLCMEYKCEERIMEELQKIRDGK